MSLIGLRLTRLALSHCTAVCSTASLPFRLITSVMAASVVLWLLLCLPLLVVAVLVRPLLLQLLPVARLPASPTSSSSSSASIPNSASPPRRVLVVGGSFAGLTFCRDLLHHVPHLHSHSSSTPSLCVTLVEPRDWFEYTPGVLRALVRPSHHRTLLTAIKDTTPARDSRFVHVQGVCSALSSNAALVTGVDGEESWLAFDYCVLALGSGYSEHIKQHDTTTARRTIAVASTFQPQPQQQQQAAGAATADGPTLAASSELVSEVPVLAPPSTTAAGSVQPKSSPSMCPFPSSAPSAPQRVCALASVHSALQASDDVMIVGAGLVGVVERTSHTQPHSRTATQQHRAHSTSAIRIGSQCVVLPAPL